MGKRGKLATIFSSLCLCVAMLVVGVYATTGIIAFNVTSSLNYEFVDIKEYLEWNGSYWTLTMGEYQGTPIVWRMVLKETEASDGTTDVESVEGYTQETDLNGSYYFLLDTYNTSIRDALACSYENNFTDTVKRIDSYGDSVRVDDYSVSNVREYLIGKNVYRGYYTEVTMEMEYRETLYSTQDAPDNFFDTFNIETSPIYSLIEGRTLSDLYLRGAYGTEGGAITFDDNVRTGKDSSGVDFEGVEPIDPDTTEDKFWLLSYYEAYKIPSNPVEGNSDLRSWGSEYWLRSPGSVGSIFPCYVDLSGYLSTPNPPAGAVNTYCARPAFKIFIN